MIKLKNILLKIFTREVEVIKPFPVPEYIIFNKFNFNEWFRINHGGIFLRRDKLSEGHIIEYIQECYGIKEETFNWGKKISDFKYIIDADWRSMKEFLKID